MLSTCTNMDNMFVFTWFRCGLSTYSCCIRISLCCILDNSSGRWDVMVMLPFIYCNHWFWIMGWPLHMLLCRATSTRASVVTPADKRSWIYRDGEHQNQEAGGGRKENDKSIQKVEHYQRRKVWYKHSYWTYKVWEQWNRNWSYQLLYTKLHCKLFICCSFLIWLKGLMSHLRLPQDMIVRPYRRI